ncbi:MAG: hypothetical protein ACKV2V_03450 [Blastocatellia bacterium]
MAQPNQNQNSIPLVQSTDIKAWLTAETMSPLGRELLRLAEEIAQSDEEPMDEAAIERELSQRRR